MSDVSRSLWFQSRRCSNCRDDDCESKPDEPVHDPVSLQDPRQPESLLQRLADLQKDSTRQWGKMNPGQMVAHCSLAMETATGDRPMKQRFLGRILSPFIRSSILGDKPFSRNAPTAPSFVVCERDFEAERKRLRGLIDRFAQQGTTEAARWTHVFFGALSGEEWGQLMYKHIDHHLRQFEA